MRHECLNVVAQLNFQRQTTHKVTHVAITGASSYSYVNSNLQMHSHVSYFHRKLQLACIYIM